jgi:hypothetical protein
MAKQTLTEQVAALKKKLASVDKRIRAIEEERARDLTAAIGFEIDVVEVDDESEYRLK